MVSTFGPNVRGVSPYADHLASALERTGAIDLTKVDYARAFPAFLLPRGTSYAADNSFARIDYLNPFSWNATRDRLIHTVHLQYWSPAFLPTAIGVLRSARNAGARTVVTWHNPRPHEPFPLLGAMERALMDLGDTIICHTEDGGRLVRQRAPDAHVAICRHGCEIMTERSPNLQDYELCGLSPEHRHVLFFGNIRPYKGLDILLDAWRLVEPRVRNARLVIAGRLWGDRRSPLSRFVDRSAGTRSHARVVRDRIAGAGPSIHDDLSFVSDEKLHAYLRIADIAVFPYRAFESQSGAASMAAGAGVPIVTTGIGGLRELAIDDRFISRDLSPKSLAETLVRHLRSGEWHRSQQLSIAKRFSWDNAARDHLACYDDDHRRRAA